MRSALFFLVIAASQNFGLREIHGRVITTSGEPIGGVTVLSMPSDEAKSNENGEFVLHKASELVRFSAPGYRPLTKNAQDLSRNAEVILVRDPQALWIPPVCLSAQAAQLMMGHTMQFTLPRGVRSRQGRDIDYETNTVCRGKSCLQHGWGPMWSFGFPPRSLLEGVNDIRERDVQFRPHVGLQGHEYRAVQSGGTLLRFVGVFGETISYDHAPKDAAEFFDKIIDSLCWQGQH